MPQTFMTKNTDGELHQPGIDKTGPVTVKPPTDSMPIEELIQHRKEGQVAPPANPQFLIVPNAVPSPSVNPGLTPSSTGGTAK
jgi:hypothetical protein